jgi:hypothetical protein
MTRPAGNPLDLRAWLETARSLGELKDVKGADAQLELCKGLSHPDLQHGQSGKAVIDSAIAG